MHKKHGTEGSRAGGTRLPRHSKTMKDEIHDLIVHGIFESHGLNSNGEPISRRRTEQLAFETGMSVVTVPPAATRLVVLC